MHRANFSNLVIFVSNYTSILFDKISYFTKILYFVSYLGTTSYIHSVWIPKLEPWYSEAEPNSIGIQPPAVDTAENEPAKNL